MGAYPSEVFGKSLGWGCYCFKKYTVSALVLNEEKVKNPKGLERRKHKGT